MDRLEEFIKANRDDLDRYDPSPGNWSKIRNRIRNEHKKIWRWVSVAAMFTIIFGSTFFYLRSRYYGSDNDYSSANESVNMNGPKQFRETEIYYNNLVNSLYREATPLLTQNPEIKKEFGSDISHLDSLCTEIRKDLKDNVDNQEVVEALIQNYRIKIQLLEDMLALLKENDSNPVKKKSHEL
jgi:DNA primase